MKSVIFPSLLLTLIVGLYQPIHAGGYDDLHRIAAVAFPTLGGSIGAAVGGLIGNQTNKAKKGAAIGFCAGTALTASIISYLDYRAALRYAAQDQRHERQARNVLAQIVKGFTEPEEIRNEIETPDGQLIDRYTGSIRSPQIERLHSRMQSEEAWLDHLEGMYERFRMANRENLFAAIDNLHHWNELTDAQKRDLRIYLNFTPNFSHRYTQRKYALKIMAPIRGLLAPIAFCGALACALWMK